MLFTFGQDPISLALFDNIISIAIGCNLAYLLISRRSRKHAVVFFLADFAQNCAQLLVRSRNLKNKRHHLELKLEEVKDGYDKLSEEKQKEHQSLYEFIKEQLENRVVNLQAEDAVIKSTFSIESCVRTSGIPCLMFCCSVYGFILLFLSGVEEIISKPLFHYEISILNLIIIIIAIYCTLFFSNFCDKTKQRWYLKPISIISLILLVGVIFYNYNVRFFYIDINGQNYTYILSVFLCWVGIFFFLLNGLIVIGYKLCSCYRSLSKNDKINYETIDTSGFDKIINRTPGLSSSTFNVS